jgi:hypothetical protein
LIIDRLTAQIGNRMFALLVLSLSLLAIYAIRRRRRLRAGGSDPLLKAFSRRDLRELDAHLDEVGRYERRRMEREIERYLTGAVGYVVRSYNSSVGVSLELSDGRRLALNGVSRRTLPTLLLRVTEDKLAPTHVERDGLTYRLRFRGQAGTKIDIYARNVAIVG